MTGRYAECWWRYAGRGCRGLIGKAYPRACLGTCGCALEARTHRPLERAKSQVAHRGKERAEGFVAFEGLSELSARKWSRTLTRRRGRRVARHAGYPRCGHRAREAALRRLISFPREHRAVTGGCFTSRQRAGRPKGDLPREPAGPHEPSSPARARRKASCALLGSRREASTARTVRVERPRNSTCRYVDEAARQCGPAARCRGWCRRRWQPAARRPHSELQANAIGAADLPPPRARFSLFHPTMCELSRKMHQLCKGSRLCQHLWVWSFGLRSSFRPKVARLTDGVREGGFRGKRIERRMPSLIYWVRELLRTRWPNILSGIARAAGFVSMARSWRARRPCQPLLEPAQNSHLPAQAVVLALLSLQLN